MFNLFVLYLSYLILSISSVYGQLSKSDNVIIKPLEVNNGVLSNKNGDLSVTTLPDLNGDKPSDVLWPIDDTYSNIDDAPSGKKDDGNYIFFDKNRGKIIQNEHGKEKAMKVNAGDKSISFVGNVDKGSPFDVADTENGPADIPQVIAFNLKGSGNTPTPFSAPAAPPQPSSSPQPSTVTKTETQIQSQVSTTTLVSTVPTIQVSTTTLVSTVPTIQVSTTTLVSTIPTIQTSTVTDMSTVEITQLYPSSSKNPKSESPCDSTDLPDPFHVGDSQL